MVCFAELAGLEAKVPGPKSERSDAVGPSEVEAGLKAKADEFREKGGEIYLSESGETREPID